MKLSNVYFIPRFEPASYSLSLHNVLQHFSRTSTKLFLFQGKPNNFCHIFFLFFLTCGYSKMDKKIKKLKKVLQKTGFSAKKN